MIAAPPFDADHLSSLIAQHAANVKRPYIRPQERKSHMPIQDPRDKMKRSAIAVALAIAATVAPPVRAPAGEPPPSCDDQIVLISEISDDDSIAMYAYDVAMTPDARFIAYSTLTYDRDIGEQTADELFVLDRQTGAIEDVHVDSNGAPLEYPLSNASIDITPDGRFVGYLAAAPSSTSEFSYPQVFLHDRQTHQTELISVNINGVPSARWCGSPEISTDGRYVAFWSFSSDLIPNGDFTCDVFIRDRQLGTTTRVTHGGTSGFPPHSGPSLGPASGYWASNQLVFSADARYLCFSGLATDLAPGDIAGTQDIFLFDQQTGTFELVSIGIDGLPGDGDSMRNFGTPNNLDMTPDARFVAFSSTSTNLVADDPNGDFENIFIRDRMTQTTTRLPISADVYFRSFTGIAISDEGRFVFFNTTMSGLVPGEASDDGARTSRRYRYDRQTDEIALVSDGLTGGPYVGSTTVSGHGGVSGNGQVVALSVYAAPVVIGDEPMIVVLRNLATDADDDCNQNLFPDDCEPERIDLDRFVASLVADAPDPAHVCLWDRNNDGNLDGLDIPDFVNALLNEG